MDGGRSGRSAPGGPDQFVLLAVVFPVLAGQSGNTLRKLGADPATASSIVFTTATDVASIALFPRPAIWLVL